MCQTIIYEGKTKGSRINSIFFSFDKTRDCIDASNYFSTACIFALAMPSNSSKLQARPLVKEGAPHQQTRNCLKIIKKKEKEKRNWLQVPDRCRTSRQTGRLTIGRNITSTLSAPKDLRSGRTAAAKV
jgi:hypothetical protein